MKKFVIAVFCLSLFVGGIVSAQENDVEHIKVSAAVEQINVNSSNLTSVDLTSKKLVGTPYIDNEFQSGRISNQETVYSFRYNAHKDEMEIELQGKAYYMPIPLSLSITFLNSEKTYEVLKNAPGANTSQGFYLQYFIGDKMSLYVKEYIKLYDEVPAKLGFSKYEPPKLSRVKDTYFITKDGTAYELPKKKKELLKLFPGKEKEIGSFIKSNKTNLKKGADLKELISYFNSMD